MLMKLKLTLSACIGVIFIGLITSITIMKNRITELNKEVEIASANIKAYEAENSELKNDTIEFQYTINQLNQSQDSLNQRIIELRRNINIKDKDIQKLQYLLTENTKKDSIVFVHDTLFVKDVKVDTTLKDDWSRLNLKLEYPNVVVANYSFRNEVLITTHLKKETVKPPHKCALVRWFQKKHKVIHVDVQEQNPYCEIKEQKFINIIE